MINWIGAVINWRASYSPSYSTTFLPIKTVMYCLSTGTFSYSRVFLDALSEIYFKSWKESSGECKKVCAQKYMAIY